MIDKETYDLINQVMDKLEASETSVPAQKVNRFLVDCLKLITSECPKVAQDAILVAEHFCNGTGTPEELYVANLACWQYLDKHRATTNTTKKEFCRIRAVICALCSEIDFAYLPVLLEFFITMMCKCGNYCPEVKDRLKNHFLT